MLLINISIPLIFIIDKLVIHRSPLQAGIPYGKSNVKDIPLLCKTFFKPCVMISSKVVSTEASCVNSLKSHSALLQYIVKTVFSHSPIRTLTSKKWWVIIKSENRAGANQDIERNKADL